MLSVNSVSTYSPKYRIESDDEAPKLPMRATIPNKPKQERTKADKQRRKAKIISAVATSAAILGSLAFVALVVMQFVSMRPKGGVLNIVSQEELAKHLGFDEMILQPDIKKFWKEQLDMIKHKDFFSKLGKEKGVSLLLYGGPGTGKTEGVYALKKYFGDDAILASIDCSMVKDQFFGNTEKKLIRSLNDAVSLCKKNPKKYVIVLLDEMSIADKDTGVNSKLTGDIQAAFKENFLKLVEQPNAIVIGTTNHADRGIPLDTLMNKEILDRFAVKQYFDKPVNDQFLDLFKKRMGEWEAAGAVEPGFFAANEEEFTRLAKEMADGGATFRSYWLGVETRIKSIAASRFEDNNITGNSRKIIIDDIKEAVNTCKREENWGVKNEEKGFNMDDVVQFLFKLLSKKETMPEA